MTTPDIFRVLPTSGDARHLGLSGCGPAPTTARRRVIPGTAKRLGQDRPLNPAGASRQDS